MRLACHSDLVLLRVLGEFHAPTRPLTTTFCSSRGHTNALSAPLCHTSWAVLPHALQPSSQSVALAPLPHLGAVRLYTQARPLRQHSNVTSTELLHCSALSGFARPMAQSTRADNAAANRRLGALDERSCIILDLGEHLDELIMPIAHPGLLRRPSSTIRRRRKPSPAWAPRGGRSSWRPRQLERRNVVDRGSRGSAAPKRHGLGAAD